jgi:4-cresol dehydrogenase (hydroxylating)
MGDVGSALAAWRHALGPAHVITDAEPLERAASATFATRQRVLAILRPANAAEVAASLRIASAHRVAVHPISKGKNWGYGSRVPPRDQSVIVDLGRMNRIQGYDEELGHVIVEPGVTPRQLAEFLIANRSSYVLPVNGGSPEISILANTLERGNAGGLYGERFAHVCALEVVLSTGEIIHTGFDRFADAHAAHCDRYGVGPALDGLFSQSNMGIVTRATMWLARRAADFMSVEVFVKHEDKLAGVVDAVRELQRDNLVHAVGFSNDYRDMAAAQQYPFKESGNELPLPERLLARARERWFGARWWGSMSVYSSSYGEALARQVSIRRRLAGHADRVVILDRAVLGAARLARKSLKHIGLDVAGFVENVGRTNDLRLPGQAGLRTAYWRKRSPMPDGADLDRDRCGVVWCAAAIPFLGRHVVEASRLAVETIKKFGFEPQLSALAMNERSGRLLALLAYDRDEPGEDERALACHDAVMSTLAGAGYPPFRLGIQSLGALPVARDDYAAVMARLKRALDPADVLSPGRYDERAHWPPAET